MKTIKAYAKFLEVFCWVIIIPFVIGTSIYNWFFDQTYWVKLYSTYNSYTRSFLLYQSLSFKNIMLPSFLKSLGIIVHLISLTLLLWGLLSLISVLRKYKQGDIFSLDVFRKFKSVSKIAFAWALYQPIKHTLLTLVATMHNPPGKRVLTLAINSNDVINIFLVGFFLVMTSLMYEGYKLKKEQDLTI